MKTTMELPDDLMRTLKLRAAHSNRRLKDVVVELLQRGLAGQPAGQSVHGLPDAVHLSGGKPWAILDIESAIESGRD